MSRRLAGAPVGLAAAGLLALTAATLWVTSDDDVAQLLDARGPVSAQQHRLGEWADTAVGADFQLGDALRTGADASAEVEVYRHGHLALGQDTVIRFTRHDGLALDRGRMDATTEGEALHIDFGTSMAVVDPRTAVSIERGEDLLISVRMGRLLVVDAEGARRWIERGARVRLTLGHLEILGPPTRVRPGTAVSALRLPQGEGPTPVTVVPLATVIPRHGDELSPRRDRLPDIDVDGDEGEAAAPDFSLPAGESFFAHDPSPPTTAALQLPLECSVGGSLVVRTRGRDRREEIPPEVDTWPLTIGTGRHRYRVLCHDDRGRQREVARGWARVTRDTGRSPLPPPPPPTRLDADGRSYRIVFQHAFPEVTIRWPNGPAGPIELRAEGARARSRVIRLNALHHTFEPRELGEGTHRLTFTSRTTDRRSPTTVVRIRYDNAGTRAEIRSPTSGTFSPGEVVTVAGIALPAWRASVSGERLQVDGSNRFVGRVSVPEGGSIAVRLARAGRHSHYYIRRSREP